MHTHVHLLMCTACAWHAQVLAQGLTLSQVTNSIADLIADRSAAGMDYGVVLVPHRATTPSAQLPVHSVWGSRSRGIRCTAHH